MYARYKEYPMAYTINNAEIAACKKEVFDCVMHLVREEYIQGNGGNVSKRVGNGDVFVVTPSQLDYEIMTVDDICVVDFDLKPVTDNGRRPSMETAMHLAIYKNRADVNAVVHTHQVFASIFALLNEPIPALFDEVANSIGNVVEVVPYGLSGSPQLMENVTGKLVNRANCYILQNHGAISVGTSLAKATRNAEHLEKCAKVYYYALSTGKPVTTLPADVQGLLAQLLNAGQDAEIARKSQLGKNSK
jgi:L-ribulose-5-phosphate 4-epimerase